MDFHAYRRRASRHQLRPHRLCVGKSVWQKCRQLGDQPHPRMRPHLLHLLYEELLQQEGVR